MDNRPAGQQRGALSDPRHGKARGEVIEGGRGARLLSQIGFVVVTVVVVALFLLLGALLADETSGSSTLRYIAYGLLAFVSLLLVFWQVRRRRNRPSLDDTLRSRRGG